MCIVVARVVTLKGAVMRVNHGFIAVRRRLYGKHVCSLSWVTAFSRLASAPIHARDGPYFSSPKCRRETFQHRYNITGLFAFSNLRSDATPVTNLPFFAFFFSPLLFEIGERISITVKNRSEWPIIENHLEILLLRLFGRKEGREKRRWRNFFLSSFFFEKGGDVFPSPTPMASGCGYKLGFMREIKCALLSKRRRFYTDRGPRYFSTT